MTDDPIPRYAQLDIWVALYGSDRSEEYEPFRETYGFAETWATLCRDIREMRGTYLLVTVDGDAEYLARRLPDTGLRGTVVNAYQVRIDEEDWGGSEAEDIAFELQEHADKFGITKIELIQSD